MPARLAGRQTSSSSSGGQSTTISPSEEDDEVCLPARRAGLVFIRLIAPTTDEARLSAILRDAAGFVYFVSITGVTGSASPNTRLVGEAVARLKRHTKLPVVVGFGVKNPDSAAAIAEAADGVVVGSSLVEAIRLSLNDGVATASTVGAVTRLVEALARGLRAVPKPPLFAAGDQIAGDRRP